MNRAIPTLGLVLGLVSLAYSGPITNTFDKAQLSTEQRSLCDRFKTSRESMSTNEWMAVERILPGQIVISEDNIRNRYSNTPEIYRDQLVDLLGGPTRETTNQMIYVCGWTNGEQHSIMLRIESGRVYRSAYRIMNP
jgi:hypothetical protein